MGECILKIIHILSFLYLIVLIFNQVIKFSSSSFVFFSRKRL